MNEPKWLSERLVLYIHKEQLIEHGGLPGVRDKGMFLSALKKAQNLYLYESSSIPFLAAAYAIGFCKNHAFVDGNKRVSFQIMYIFLGLNNLRIVASEPEVVKLMLSVADGTIDEKHLAQWLRDHTEPR